MKKILVTLAIAMAFAATQNAYAVDLTLNGTGFGSLNGGIFQRAGFQPAGSGFIASFVRIGAANQDFVQGYNTSARPLQFDENSSPTFTHDIQLQDVGTVVGTGSNGTTAGVSYKEFILDINQTGSDPLLTLNRVVVTITAANQTGSGLAKGTRLGGSGGLFPGNDTVVYDSGAGNLVQLDYNLGAGSGIGDMSLLIRADAFTNISGVTGASFITLYSEFGNLASDGTNRCADRSDYNANNPTKVPTATCYANNNDGYEEWAFRVSTPNASSPEPTSLVLLGFALVGIGIAKRRMSN